MDINLLLEETEETFPTLSEAWQAEELSETVKSLTSSLMLSVTSPIHDSIKALLPFKEIQTSHLDAYWHLVGNGDLLRPFLHICSARIRPSNEYLGIQPHPIYLLLFRTQRNTDISRVFYLNIAGRFVRY